MKAISVLKPYRIIFRAIFIVIMLGGFLSKPPGSRANPVAFPIITEILFTENGFELELLLWDYYEDDFLDNYRITGLYGTGYFLPGIPIPDDGLMVISEDDFSPGFFINPEGDALRMEYWDGYEWLNIDYVPMVFGEVPQPYQSWVSAQKGQESIAYQIIWSMQISESWAVKELPHSIGSDPMNVTLREEFSGYVRNLTNQPLPYIRLKYCTDGLAWYLPLIVTDVNGYFYADSMFCRKYHIVFMDDEIRIDSTVIFIEPDSANYFEFVIDYLPTLTPQIPAGSRDYTIRVAPNPVSTQFKILVTAPDYTGFRKGVIKIFNSEGIITGIMPLEIKGILQELAVDPGESHMTPGTYLCTLEIEGERKASVKMVIPR